jgi:hypothetical protein
MRAAAQVRAVLVERIWERLRGPAIAATTHDAIEGVAAHLVDPYAAADRLLAALRNEEPR